MPTARLAVCQGVKLTSSGHHRVKAPPSLRDYLDDTRLPVGQLDLHQKEGLRTLEVPICYRLKSLHHSLGVHILVACLIYVQVLHFNVIFVCLDSTQRHIRLFITSLALFMLLHHLLHLR